MMPLHEGACLCGAVRLRLDGAFGSVDACHCSQCRKWSGHVWASSDVERSDLTIAGEESLVWYQSSEKVRRGFCRNCGSSLLWDVVGRARIAVAMGVFETPTNAHLHMHIFTADKGDYYPLDDGVPTE